MTPGLWEWELKGEPQSVKVWTLKGPDVLCRFWGEGPPTDEARKIAAVPEWLTALKSIAEGEGAFNRDPLKHAENCIEHAKELAKAAIKLAEPRGK